MMRARPSLMLVMACVALMVTGCSSTPPRKTGGYYQDDGPGRDIPSDIDQTPDATPRIEPLSRGASRPYSVLGKRYVPITDPDRAYKQRGIASWYGRKFHGKRTAIGERYDMYAMTAAHPTMPLPSYARVTSSVNGHTVIVRINDRGPFHRGRIMDLSYAAAKKLGLIAHGSGEVTVERILPQEIRKAEAEGKTVTALGTSAPSAPPVETAPKVAAVAPFQASLAGDETDGATTPDHTAGGRYTSIEQITGNTGIQHQRITASTPDSTRQNGTIYLQMGAFSQPANAQALAQRVNQQLAGKTGNTSVAIQQNGSLYRVWLGPYADRETALTMAQQVADRTGIRPDLATQ